MRSRGGRELRCVPAFWRVLGLGVGSWDAQVGMSLCELCGVSSEP